MEQAYQEKNGTALTSEERIKQDPLASLIVSIINAMEADYGRAFSKQFSDPDVLKNYKRRLYQKLKGLPLDCIVDGYEDAAESSPKFCPTVHQLVESILKIKTVRKKEEEKIAEVKRVSALPAPTHSVDVTKVFEDAKQVANNHPSDEESRLERLNAARQNHNAVLSIHGGNVTKRTASHDHLCGYSGCNKAGAISAGLKGENNFYCNEHFRST